MYEGYILDKTYFIESLKDMAAMVEEKKDYFTELDAVIGDSDHGVNLSIGFRGVMAEIEQWEDLTVGEIMKKAGWTLLGKVGGASGPLYGSFFMSMNKPVKDKEEINFLDFANMLNAGVESIEKRGKAVVLDKTMVDTFRPAIDALNQAMEEGKEPKMAFEDLMDAAGQGRDKTLNIVAKKGRAKILGERALGHLDPGAVSSYEILKIFFDNLK